jgi:DNA-binding response OmpR family regulator
MTRIVLIEDDDTQRTLTALVLRSRGYLVLEASGGEQGMRAIRRERPDLVVCDVLMPDMNGYQVLAAVRGEPAIAATPVIMLTGLVERGHTRLGMASGADDYLHKPYQPDELIQAVESVARRSRTQRDAVVGEIQATWEETLSAERESLAATYEHRLLQELNSRWVVETRSEPEVRIDPATVLWADLFRPFRELHATDEQVIAQLRMALQSARDTMFLFGALEVIHQGQDLVAVFRDSTETSTAATRAVRAALALQARAGTILPAGTGASLTVAVHSGPLTLMRVLDPLNGDSGVVPVPGATLNLLHELGVTARHKGWQVAATGSVTGKIEGLQSLAPVDSLPTRDGTSVDIYTLGTRDNKTGGA